jgi:hypothetical protein
MPAAAVGIGWRPSSTTLLALLSFSYSTHARCGRRSAGWRREDRESKKSYDFHDLFRERERERERERGREGEREDKGSRKRKEALAPPPTYHLTPLRVGSSSPAQCSSKKHRGRARRER